MSQRSLDSWARDVMSGSARGLGPTALRAALGAVEPAYAGVAALRNRAFDRGSKAVHRLSRPVISVGNLTTGGTGKTPFVQWLTRELIDVGHRPAILMRGYARADAASESDEQRVLRESLPDVPIYADPDRVAAGTRAIAERPAISVFVLDDGFQHRRLARDVDIVLIDATNPFGYDHVLPRGMLRERPGGLARANLVAITRVERVSVATVDEIESRIRSLVSPRTPIVRAAYQMDDVMLGDGPSRPLASFAGQAVAALSAIGNPQAFEDGLAAAGLQVVVRARFADHHRYRQADFDGVASRARAAEAELVITTGKDWAKLRELNVAAMPIGRVGVRVGADAAMRSAVRGEIAKRISVPSNA